MPTLLQLNVTLNWGSHGKIAEDIGCLALSRGWRSLIAYGRSANSSKNELIRIGGDVDIYEHLIETRLFDNHGLASRNATKGFIKRIEEIHPDVIHLHNIHGYYLNYRLLFEFLSKTDTPIIWTLHDCWPFTGHCGFFDIAQCNQWKTGCHVPCPLKKEYPSSFLYDKSEQNWRMKRDSFNSVKNMTLVPVSEWLGELVKDSFLGSYPVKVIHNGIDIEVFKPAINLDNTRKKYKLYGKKILLGVANIWSKRKGMEDFIALRKLLDDDFLIVLVGLTEKQQKNLPNGIIGIKRTQNQQELAELYSLSDIFINPTYEDNYPTTNLEAMACGTPVITYNTGGSPESVTAETGVVVEKGNVNHLLGAINQILGTNREKYTLSCRKRAEEYFDKKLCYEEYMKLYESFI
jgi:glycosyltransferase involved in cell wall biosynthesis